MELAHVVARDSILLYCMTAPCVTFAEEGSEGGDASCNYRDSRLKTGRGEVNKKTFSGRCVRERKRHTRPRYPLSHCHLMDS